MSDSLPPDSHTALARWVQPRHLQADAIVALRRRFQASPERYMVIDDFLAPEHLPKIRQVLLEDGIVKTFFRVYGTREWVTKEQFEGVGDDCRFIHEGIYVGPHPDKRMSPAVLTDMMFRKELKGPAFHQWLTAITGQPVGHTGTINLKSLGREHFLRWHSDQVPGRVLCAVLYLHTDWRAEFGGRLLMQRQDGGIDCIEPATNRLILFDPQSNINHAVEPMTEAAGDWARLNYSAWFYQRNGQGE
ncbi:2OG-Fe(II) oxygenase [Azospirillum sp. B506]|uniref:2OG-Fe(II) oxygenase n=1 Tax=Azospirillum sp. B506 TaxID=137721 RepID=UPI00034BDFDD|nr:2OG-Fe(II) oxygenase [Azospirillum sp. B506]